MKRIISACLEQTQKFESLEEFEAYQNSLDRKHIKYKIVDKQEQPGHSVSIKIIRSYNDYPVGNYMD
ncbi:hypothetical protein [Diplocloster modestus]|uniref:Uncharacterized protein n=1 Tax=Diplocloster modestus TaxID=2850322 RepID=A0ABS6KAA2_9FIRM|nr:hypothetical protein [Diplocloster modestus]MBU9727448.1 hypothetical protein [Diplocloster modestus]